MSCNTEDQAATGGVWDVRRGRESPQALTPLFFELDKRLVELSKAFPLTRASRCKVLLRGSQADVELFRPENVPLETELAKLSQKYDQVAGAMSVRFEGEEKTLPQMARYQEVQDRSVREWARGGRLRSGGIQDAGSHRRDLRRDDRPAASDRIGKNAGF